MIAVLAIIGTVVVMVPVIAIVVMAVMMVVAMMHVVLVAVRVGVNEKPRERADRRGIGHADSWGQGKHGRHRPKEGDAASACSTQSRQHAFEPRQVRLSQHGLSKA